MTNAMDVHVEVAFGKSDKVAVTEALRIIQHGNDFRRDPEQSDTRRRRPRRNAARGIGVGRSSQRYIFRIPFQSKLADVVVFGSIV